MPFLSALDRNTYFSHKFFTVISNAIVYERDFSRKTNNLYLFFCDVVFFVKISLLFIALTYSFLASQIESLESELADLASSEFDRQIKLLTSIKEIGITLATALIVATGGFSYFDNAKQISRFIGICPTYQQSGTSVHIKGGINRNGDVSLRSLLYAASWSALRGNTTCKECYTRLKANGNLPRWLLLLLQTSSSGKHLP